MNFTTAIRRLERQATRSKRLAAAEQAKAAALRKKLQAIQNLLGILGRSAAGKAAPKAKRSIRKRRGGMSAAGRAHVAAAQRKRWAAWKANQKASRS